MTSERSLLCSAIAFYSCINPSESIAKVRDNSPLPLLSIPCAEDVSLATSIPTKSSGMALPPWLAFRQDRVCLPTNPPALPGLFDGPIILSWLREAGNRLYSGFFDPGRTKFSCLTDLFLFIPHLSVGGSTQHHRITWTETIRLSI